MEKIADAALIGLTELPNGFELLNSLVNEPRNRRFKDGFEVLDFSPGTRLGCFEFSILREGRNQSGKKHKGSNKGNHWDSGREVKVR